MITISLCMILKDEEDVLDRCLSSVKGLVDEIIIVDTGSTDATKQIALQYTDQVFDFAWIDDFAAARNYAFSKANMEYCMWLDADDVIEEKDRLDFLTLKNTLTLDTDIVMMRYNTAFDDDGNPSFWYYRERIIRNDQSHPWQGKLSMKSLHRMAASYILMLRFATGNLVQVIPTAISIFIENCWQKAEFFLRANSITILASCTITSCMTMRLKPLAFFVTA